MLRRHILPNTAGVLVVAVFLELPTVILGEAYISVLGLGLDAPAPSWGNIAYDGFGLDRPGTSLATAARYGLSLGHPWLVILPSIVIGIVALCANYVADGLQAAFDPRLSAAHARRSRPRGLVRTLHRSVAGGR